MAGTSHPGASPNRVAKEQSQPTAANRRMSQRACSVMLVAAAVLVGTLVLAFGTEDRQRRATPAPARAAPDSRVSADQSEKPVGPPAAMTREAVDLRSPNEVRVLVANSTGEPGAAAQVANKLVALGYLALPPTNTDAPAGLAKSLLYVAEGYEDDAVAIAEVVGLEQPRLSEMADEPPVNDPLDAHIIIVLGEDLLARGS